MPISSICFGLYDDETIVGFCAVIHAPHPINKRLKRASRLVILPDYQGIGLGVRFLNIVAEYYKQLGYDFRIVTSAKNMIHALNKSDKWKMVRWSANKMSKTGQIDKYRKTIRTNCKTAGYKYI